MYFGKKITLILFCACFIGCVKKQVYETELNTRKLAEAREQVLSEELNDRKTENVSLIKQVGDLNRIIGKQEGDIAQLRADIVSRTQSAGLTTQQLLDEKRKTEGLLTECKTALQICNEEVSSIVLAQQAHDAPLNNLLTAVKTAFKEFPAVQIVLDGDNVQVTIPDKELFEANGTALAKRGREVLAVLGSLLSARPSLDIDLIAYTDNQLPKGNKAVTDTWDWSLLRALVLTRTLVTDFGVNANQLSPVGRGEFYPLTTNETAEGRAGNRRTQIVFKPVLPVVPNVE